MKEVDIMTKWYSYRFEDGYETISNEYSENAMNGLIALHGKLVKKIWIG